MATKITGDVLESYLQCKYKGYLKLAGEQGIQSDYELLLVEARNQVRLAAADKLRVEAQEDDVLQGPTLTRARLKQGVPLLLEGTTEDERLSIRFDALQKEAGPSRLGDFHYIPVLFHEAERPGRLPKDLLALYGLIVGGIQGRQPSKRSADSRPREQFHEGQTEPERCRCPTDHGGDQRKSRARIRRQA